MPGVHFSEIQTAACVFFLLLAPLAGAGLALINAGLGRTRNAAHSMMAALCVISVAACVYFVCGRAFQGYAGGLSHSITITGKALGNKTWDWIGAEPWFFRGLPMNPSPNALPVLLSAWFGILAAGLAGLIPLGSGADRWRLAAICASTALLGGLTFPLGWRLSRPIGRELWLGTRLSRCRRRGSDPCVRRIDGSRNHVDRRTPQGQVHVGRNADGDPRSQRGFGSFRMHGRVCWMAGAELGRGNVVCGSGRGPGSADRREHPALRILLRPRDCCNHQSAIR
jgi:hypothetical protein